MVQPTMVDLTYFVYPIDLSLTAFVPFDELANCPNPAFAVSLESFSTPIMQTSLYAEIRKLSHLQIFLSVQIWDVENF